MKFFRCILGRIRRYRIRNEILRGDGIRNLIELQETITTVFSCKKGTGIKI
jgi:hypothetical protein